jgi:hypothetical protein
LAGKAKIRTIDDLIVLWPSDAEFGRDIGVKPSHVGVMKVRKKIPSEHWQAIIDAAARRHAEDPDQGFDQVTAQLLLDIQTRTAQHA